MTLDKLVNTKVLVIGDVILDKYIFGDVSRISPEAPVPVLKAEKGNETLGGAANVANNIASLRAKCCLVGIAGHDENRGALIDMLRELGVENSLIDAGQPTTTKIRVIGQRQQIVRIDYEEILPADSPVFAEVEDISTRYMQEAGVVVLSDYGKGLISDSFCKSIIRKASAGGKIVVVDPKGNSWEKYKGASIITPNVNELSEIAGEKVANTDEGVVSVGQRIRREYHVQYLVVTRSEKGITIIAEDGVMHFPTQAQEVFDVSGAGDTVVAALACALAGGYSIGEAVKTANIAAGIVVSKIGTVPVTYRELAGAISGDGSSSAMALDEALEWVKRMRQSGKKVVFTNGCFDILHRGHVDYLRKARKLGDLLVVGLNSDESVRRLKGEGRPVNSQEDRAFLLAALACVDAVVLFEEDTPYELLSRLRPDILVKGGDYRAENVVGREFAKDVAIIDFVDGYSTTSVIQKLNRE